MKRRVILSTLLREFISHLSPELKKKVRKVLDEILNNPKAGKLLMGRLAGFFSYKIGKVRIVYCLKDSDIFIVSVGPRKTVYEKILLEMAHQTSR